MLSVCVRPSRRFPGKFEIIDGMWRYTVCWLLALDTIPCIIKHGITDDDVLAMQVQTNSIRGRTKPVEFSSRLKTIFDRQPGMSMTELATRVRQGVRWVKDRLGLLRLEADIQLMIDRNEISLGNAYMLAKVPDEFRRDLLNDARTMTCRSFRLLAAKIIKNKGEERNRKNQIARYKDEFAPVAHLRRMEIIKGEAENPRIMPLLLAAHKITDPLDACVMCFRWLLHLDPESLELQKLQKLSNANKKRKRYSPKGGDLSVDPGINP